MMAFCEWQARVEGDVGHPVEQAAAKDEERQEKRTEPQTPLLSRFIAFFVEERNGVSPS